MRVTKVVVAMALFAGLVACTGDNTTSESSDGVESTAVVSQSTVLGATPTTLAPADPSTVYPLTGLPITDEAVASRPALVVKIDNDSSARPQNGLNAADIVFEQIIEIGTRFAAVYHSQGSDPVGPVRSARSQDASLLECLVQPLFVYSGANPGVTALIEASDLVGLNALDESVFTDGGFFRDDSRVEPFNEYAATTQLWTLAPAGAGPPPQQFRYRAIGEAAAGDASSGVDLYLEGVLVGWRYDASTGLYLRMSDGTPHLDAASDQVSTHNVVVLVVDYPPSVIDARSPEADTIGFGAAWVFSGGTLIRGVWTRADSSSPFELTGPSGPIALTPGRTWVELSRDGSFTAVP